MSAADALLLHRSRGVQSVIVMRIAPESPADLSRPPAEKRSEQVRTMARRPAARRAGSIPLIVLLNIGLASCRDVTTREEAVVPGQFRKVWSIETQPGGAAMIAVSADGSRVATAGFDDRVVVYDSSTLNVVRVCQAIGTTRMAAVALSPDGSAVAALCHCGTRTVRAWDVGTGTALAVESSGGDSGRLHRRLRGDVTVHFPQEIFSPIPESLPSSWLSLFSEVRPGRRPIPRFDGTSTLRDGRRMWFTDRVPSDATGELSTRFSVVDAWTAETLGEFGPPLTRNADSGRWAVDAAGERLALVRDGVVHEAPLAPGQTARDFGSGVKFVAGTEEGWVTASREGELTCWKDGVAVRRVAEDVQEVFSLAVAGSLIVLEAMDVGSGRKVDTILRSVRSGELVERIPHSRVITWRGDGGALVVGQGQRVWRVFRDGAEVEAGTAAEPPGASIGRTPPLPTAAGLVFLRDGLLVGRDLSTGRDTVAGDAHRGSVMDVSWTNSGLVVHVRSEYLFLDPDDGRTAKSVPRDAMRVHSERTLDRATFAFDSDSWPRVSGNGEVVACVARGTLVLRRSADATEIWRPGEGVVVSASDLEVSHDGTRVAALALENGVTRLCVWDLRDGKTTWSIPWAGRADIGALVLAPDGTLGVQTIEDNDLTGPLIVHDPEGRESGRIPRSDFGYGFPCAFSSDSRYLAACEPGVGVVVMALAAGGRITRYPVPSPERGVPSDIRPAMAGRGFILGGIVSDRSFVGFFETGLLEDSEMWHARGGLSNFGVLQDGRLACLTQDGLLVRDSSNGKVVERHPGILGLDLSLLPDGRGMAVVHANSIELYERRQHAVGAEDEDFARAARARPATPLVDARGHCRAAAPDLPPPSWPEFA